MFFIAISFLTWYKKLLYIPGMCPCHRAFGKDALGGTRETGISL